MQRRAESDIARPRAARWRRRLSATLPLVLAMATAAHSGGAKPGVDAWTREEIAAVRKAHAAGSGLVPLFVLGDINEDGLVDRKDLALMRRIVAADGHIRPSATISCPAAADLGLRGTVDRRDLAILADWIKRGITAPALSYQSALPCNFKHLFIAANLFVKPGEVARIRFLDPALRSSNSMVTIEDGVATVVSAVGGRGFDIRVRQAAKTGDQIVLKIVLPGGLSYYYTLPVNASPEGVSPSD